jgi:tellurite resistance protein
MNTDQLETVQGTLAENASFTDAIEAEKAEIENEEKAAEEATLLAGLVEAAYLMAIADDGQLSQEEADAMADGLYTLTDISEDALGTLLGVATSRHENEGAPARIAALGEDIPDPDHRRGAFLVASAVSWKGGGIGMKQGLALQALARAFHIPTHEMQVILGKAHG